MVCLVLAHFPLKTSNSAGWWESLAVCRLWLWGCIHTHRGNVSFDYKVGQIGLKRDKSGTFQNIFPCILAWRAKMFESLIWISPGFVLIWNRPIWLTSKPNLTPLRCIHHHASRQHTPAISNLYLFTGITHWVTLCLTVHIWRQSGLWCPNLTPLSLVR